MKSSAELDRDLADAVHRKNRINTIVCTGLVCWLLVLVVYQLASLTRAVEIVANKMP